MTEQWDFDKAAEILDQQIRWGLGFLRGSPYTTEEWAKICRESEANAERRLDEARCVLLGASDATSDN